MGWYDTVLAPFKLAVAWIMVGIQKGLVLIGFPDGPGITWVMTIVVLTILVRILIIPLYIKQIRSSRGMAVIQPQMKAIREKYKGKRDQVSQQQMNQEMQKIYREYSVNPMASCFPLIIQLPVLAALYRVLYQAPLIAEGQTSALGVFDKTLASDMDQSTLFGSSLSSTFSSGASGTKTLIVIAIILYAVLMFLQQFINFKLNMANQNDQQARMMKMMMYFFPFLSAWFGFVVQLGVMVYLAVTMIFSFLQQLAVIYFLPTPHSKAHQAMLKRHQKKYDAFKQGEVQSYRQKLAEAGLSEDDVARAQRIRTKAHNKARINGQEVDPFENVESGESLAQALKLYDQHQATLHQKAQKLELEEKPRDKNKKPSRMQRLMDKQMEKAQAQGGFGESTHNPQAQPKRLTRAQREAQSKRRAAYEQSKANEVSPEELEQRRQERQKQRREQRKKKRNRN